MEVVLSIPTRRTSSAKRRRKKEEEEEEGSQSDLTFFDSRGGSSDLSKWLFRSASSFKIHIKRGQPAGADIGPGGKAGRREGGGGSFSGSFSMEGSMLSGLRRRRRKMRKGKEKKKEERRKKGFQGSCPGNEGAFKSGQN